MGGGQDGPESTNKMKRFKRLPKGTKTRIERFENENSSIDPKLVCNTQYNNFMAVANCNNFRVQVYLSKVLFRFNGIRYKPLRQILSFYGFSKGFPVRFKNWRRGVLFQCSPQLQIFPFAVSKCFPAFRYRKVNQSGSANSICISEISQFVDKT